MVQYSSLKGLDDVTRDRAIGRLLALRDGIARDIAAGNKENRSASRAGTYAILAATA